MTSNDETTNQGTNTMNEWLNCTKMLLEAVENRYIQPRDISIVLEKLKNSSNKEAPASNDETTNQYSDTKSNLLNCTKTLLKAMQNSYIQSRSVFKVLEELKNSSNKEAMASNDETTNQGTNTMNEWEYCTKTLLEAVKNSHIQSRGISVVLEELKNNSTVLVELKNASKKEAIQDTYTMNEWLNCTKTVLGAVEGGFIQSRSIPIVPEEHKNLSNKEAYMPRVVSIGPRFKGTREDLLLMEEVKLRCMVYLMHRAGEGGESETYFENCGQAIWKIDEEIRASYVYDIKLTKKELANTMLMDGCFLLELMIAKDSELNSKHQSRWGQPGQPSPSPALKVLKDEDVLSDIIMLENQIPILVLHILSQVLFPDSFQADLPGRVNRINNLFLSILGYSPHSQLSNPIYLTAPHILDIVHYFVNSTKGKRESNAVGNSVVLPINDAQRMKPKLKRCALRLQAAGVTIKVTKETSSKISRFSFLRNCFGGIFIKCGNMIVTNNRVDAPTEVNGLDFSFKFKEGKLKISQLHITKTTKAKWRNIIAWEHHKNNWKSAIPPSELSQRRDDNQINMSSLSRKFTSSALIFDSLICCDADVKLLKEKNIIVDHLKMTNEELEAFFHTMALGLDCGIVDSSHVKIVDDLNNYSNSHSFFIVRILKIFWHLFKYRLERLVIFLKKNYNFVAALLAFLTLLQTVYTVLSYHLPK